MDGSSNIRKIMVEELIKEVQGPRHGANEVIAYDPWVEYLTGIIIPQNWEENSSALNPDKEITQDIDNTNTEDGFSEDDIISNFKNATLNPRSLIKSFGISFTTTDPNPTLSICATWGRYFPDYDSETGYYIKGKEINKEDIRTDKLSDLMKRESFGQIFDIQVNDGEIIDDSIEKLSCNDNELIIVKKLKEFESERVIKDPDDDGYVKIHIKRLKVNENQYIISVYMINDLDPKQSPGQSKPLLKKCIFQPSIRINCDSKIEPQKIDITNDAEAELSFLYRNKPTRATGHMCSVVWSDVDYREKININQLWADYELRSSKNDKYKEFLDPDIRSEFIPLFPVTLPNFNLDEKYSLDNDLFNAEQLANKSPNDIYDSLIKLCDNYEKWVGSNKLLVFDDENYINIVKNIINAENQALNRMRRGLELIRDNDLIYTAFCFANKTISLQNTWGKKDFVSFKWRPFQIAFFLMNIEDIYDETSKNRDVLDLLWIATGGGKTESYLGIIAFTIALRRLKAYKNNETGAGTSVLSRYTLRLLTVQQFRRTLKMITAAELLRVNNESGKLGWRPKFSKMSGDWIYGSTRFSTGLWVGGGVSPNHLLTSDGAINSLRGISESPYKIGEPAQILKCPVCGSWLSIPSKGFTDDKNNNVHIVIKCLSNEDDINSILNIKFKDVEGVDYKGISSKNHNYGNYTLSFEIHSKLSRMEFKDNLLDKLTDFYPLEPIEILSLGDFNPGYFSSLDTIIKPRKDATDGGYDFEVWCTNPNCDLNNINWSEGSPYPNGSEPIYPDGNYEREIASPFIKNTRMPIPGYVIDDHIYNRCPTVIISTVDKIARLAFEAKTCGIFGNVNYYNKYYGYNRDAMLPKKSIGSVKRFNKEIKPLKAPELIIQDELHLINGPLGSLFGLYEAIVDSIIKSQGGNPKYIASTATISNAKKQVDVLFSKKLFQFPPHGLDIKDNFFVTEFDEEDAWDETRPGRLYMGIYTPGQGTITPQMRLWAKMLNVPNHHKEEDNYKYYWTLLSYYNSIKELGTGLALYRDVIKTRLKSTSFKENYRKLTDDCREELSSRILSTDLPILLDDLEKDGKEGQPKYDAIFTTSMFGTGVDVPHLSLMLMNAQPKTTGSYIQATGRIGRKTGGLVVDFFKPGRSRDLNHYEMFSSFHSKIYLDVEPVSVSPFSEGCLSRGLGPALVAFLRNANELSVNWEDNKDAKKPILNEKSRDDINKLYSYLKDRLLNMDNIETDDVQNILCSLNECANDWERVAGLIKDKKLLQMFEYYQFRPQQNVVLGSSGHEYNDNLKVVYKNAPQSLRDIEESIDFWV